MPVLARKTRRWVACFIDFSICFLIIGLIAYCFGTATPNDEGETSWNLTGFPAFFAFSIPWLIFLPGMEWINNGQTIGKAILRIKVTNMDGSKAGFGTLLLKHFFDWVDYLPFFGIVGLIVAANNPQKQRVGDLVAKTIVVDKQR